MLINYRDSNFIKQILTVVKPQIIFNIVKVTDSGQLQCSTFTTDRLFGQKINKQRNMGDKYRKSNRPLQNMILKH